MRVLVACEFSGRVRDAFLARGHDAISCDLCHTWSEGPHYRGDVRDILTHSWDMMIAFPPCTYLSRSGAQWYWNTPEQAEALQFVDYLLNAPIERIALENPVGRINTAIRKPDQIIQPWMFGHGERKTTCLWLKNLPCLVPTEIVEDRKQRTWYLPPTLDRSVKRSITLPGIAAAMAEQWSFS